VKEVYYLAHPVTGDPEGNAYKAIAWIHWLTLADPDRIYVAPWVAEVLAFKSDIGKLDKSFYDRVLADDQEVVRHLDGVLLVGGAISYGMSLELDAAIAAGKKVIDWHMFKVPEDVPQGLLPSDPPSVVRARMP
jgi:hypothetical protein